MGVYYRKGSRARFIQEYITVNTYNVLCMPVLYLIYDLMLI